MKLHLSTHRLVALLGSVRGMFNLNDPRWGRGDEKPGEGDKPGPSTTDSPPKNTNERQPKRAPNQGPPDLDELWRDFNRKLSGLFSGVKNGGRGNNGGGSGGDDGSGGGFQPDMKSAGIGVGLIMGVVVLIWLGTGFFIVQEGQQAVITQFGKYKTSVGPGFNWRLP